jgi:hypothetical protein
VLYIDTIHAGEHRQAFHSAVRSFWETHLKETFYAVAQAARPSELEFTIRAHEDKRADQLVVNTADDVEGNVLTALELWWVGRSRG